MKRLVSFAFVSWLAFRAGGCILSPQPDPPDAADILVSSTGGPGGSAGEVAVIGRPGAVPPYSRVRVERTEGPGAAETDASADGSFALAIWANQGEVLRVTYFSCEDRSCESAPVDARVDLNDADDDPSGTASPYPPGEYAGDGPPTDIFVDPPEAGIARVWCPAGCMEDNVRVVVGNHTSGFVRETVHGTGDFSLGVPAQEGDLLLVFAVRPENPDQTSRVVQLVVPAAAPPP